MARRPTSSGVVGPIVGSVRPGQGWHPLHSVTPLVKIFGRLDDKHDICRNFHPFLLIVFASEFCKASDYFLYLILSFRYRSIFVLRFILILVLDVGTGFIDIQISNFKRVAELRRGPSTDFKSTEFIDYRLGEEKITEILEVKNSLPKTNSKFTPENSNG